MKSCFESAVWPEDQFADKAERYRKCEVCTQRSRVIWGEGNPKAAIFIILDNPGAREDKDGNQYVCPTRHTLQKALHQANLAADDIYLTYLLKCRSLRQYNKEKARAFSKLFLIRQIEKMRPKLIVCLCDVVTRTMFDDQDACVKELRGKWHEILGYPCMVSYHPLAVRRRPNLSPIFMEDFNMLSEKIRSLAD